MLLTDLCRELVEKNGSDVHLVTGSRPTLRIDGYLIPAEFSQNVLTEQDVFSLFEPYLNDRQEALLGSRQDVYASVAVDESPVSNRYGEARQFKACIFYDSNGLGALLRVVPNNIPGLSELFSPEIEATFRSLINRKRGLILIVGSTGSGKSTTVASMIDTINAERNERIYTLEDPVEYVYASKTSLVSQREVGVDVDSYEMGAISLMWADPDVVLLGELRTPEAVRIGLALADTGHLVFGTMHAESASEAVRRLIEAFPETRQTIQSTMARSLIAVIRQQLVPRASGGSRVAAHEIMIVNSKIRRMIEEGQTDLTVAIEAGRNEGMRTMDDSLVALYRNGAISYERACARASDWKLVGPVSTQPNGAPAENRTVKDESLRRPNPGPKNSLGESLVDKRVITEEQLKNARQVQMSARGDLGNIVQDLGYASEKDVAKVRATVLGLQFADLKEHPPHADAIKTLPDDIARRYNILPIKREGNRLMVAVADLKASMAGIDEVRLATRCVVFPVLATRKDLQDALAHYYPPADGTLDAEGAETTAP